MRTKLPDPARERSASTTSASSSSSAPSEDEDESRRTQRAASATSEVSIEEHRTQPIEANAVIRRSIPAETVNASTDDDDGDYDEVDGRTKKRKDSKEEVYI